MNKYGAIINELVKRLQAPDISEDEKQFVLNEKEKAQIKYQTLIANTAGYNIDFTALTTILKTYVEEKFFKIAPADFVPIAEGEGAYSDQLIRYRVFDSSDDFEKGILDTGEGDSRLAETDIAVDAVPLPVVDWAKLRRYNLIELQKATKANNFGLIEKKEKSRKRNYDLGIQRTAFLGSRKLPLHKGLLNQDTGAGTDEVTLNTTFITNAGVGGLTGQELNNFAAQLIPLFRDNCNGTEMPNCFIMPEDERLKLSASSSNTFHIKSKLQFLLEAFKEATENPDFKIKGVLYANPNRSGGALTLKRYALYYMSPDTMQMELPVGYTPTAMQSIDGFEFRNVAYAEYTGVKVYRAPELMYFDQPN